VLLFGDSNTWGFVPGTHAERIPFGTRIPETVQARVGAGFRIVEEALSGCMTAWDDPLTPDRNGARQLPFLLETHRPIDMISIMLGTNDLKRYMNLGPVDCAMGQVRLVDLIEAAGCGPGGARPRILLIAPPLVVESPTPFGHIFDGAIEKSRGFVAAYREIAEQRQCLFLDAGSLVRTSTRDGIHLEADAHRKLGEAIAEAVLRELA
jgi:lysophospholipase L1-like esterase